MATGKRKIKRVLNNPTLSKKLELSSKTEIKIIAAKKQEAISNTKSKTKFR